MKTTVRALRLRGVKRERTGEEEVFGENGLRAVGHFTFIKRHRERERLQRRAGGEQRLRMEHGKLEFDCCLKKKKNLRDEMG